MAYDLKKKKKKEIATATLTFSSHHPNHSVAINIKTLHQQKDYDLLKALMMVSIFFSNNLFLNYVLFF